MREMKGKHFSTLPLVPLPAYVCTVDDDGLVAVNACEHSVISSGRSSNMASSSVRKNVEKIEIEMQILHTGSKQSRFDQKIHGI